MKHHKNLTASLKLLLIVGVSSIMVHHMNIRSDAAPPFVEAVTAKIFETATFALG